MATTLAVALLGVMFVGVGGCSREGATLLPAPFSEGDLPLQLPPPPSEEERARWQTIGVTLAANTPERGFQTWIIGGPAEGAVKGTAEGFGLGTLAGGSAGVVGIILFAPVGAVAGGVGGARAAVPDATADEIDAFVEATFDGGALGTTLRDHVVVVVADETGLPVTVLGPYADESADTRCSTDLQLTTLLELGVTGYGFFGIGGDDPNLAVVLAIRTRVIDLASCQERHALWLGYVSAPRKYSEWQLDATTALQDEISLGAKALAEKIVEEVFLLYLPEEARRDNTINVADRTIATVMSRG